jgi:hypothetical protein
VPEQKFNKLTDEMKIQQTKSDEHKQIMRKENVVIKGLPEQENLRKSVIKNDR